MSAGTYTRQTGLAATIAKRLHNDTLSHTILTMHQPLGVSGHWRLAVADRNTHQVYLFDPLGRKFEPDRARHFQLAFQVRTVIYARIYVNTYGFNCGIWVAWFMYIFLTYITHRPQCALLPFIQQLLEEPNASVRRITDTNRPNTGTTNQQYCLHTRRQLRTPVLYDFLNTEFSHTRHLWDITHTQGKTILQNTTEDIDVCEITRDDCDTPRIKQHRETKPENIQTKVLRTASPRI